jgi:16S rRNA (adenine1518-N6/adenine1519-N6)-dimethyltransferase
MQTLSEIKSLLEAKGLSPRKVFGQNFLIDHNLIKKLVDASGAQSCDVILEVGPGTGTLTEELLARGCFVIAAEIDRGLSELLRERFSSHGERFILVEGDCLDGKRSLAPALVEAVNGAMHRARRETFRLVSNLPYGAGTSVMAILLADYPTCISLSVTIQKEVAERLLAGPGSRDFGPVSVLAQAVADLKLVATLPPECFWPRPDITSAMLSMQRKVTPLTTDPRGLLDAAQRVFEKRRKQLGASLGKDVVFPDSVQRMQRAEELTIAQFVDLAAALKAADHPTTRPAD